MKKALPSERENKYESWILTARRRAGTRSYPIENIEKTGLNPGSEVQAKPLTTVVHLNASSRVGSFAKFFNVS